MENVNFPKVLFFISHFLLLLSSSNAQSILNNFVQCLSASSSSLNVLYIPANPSYASLLESTAQSRRFLTSTTPKPLSIVNPSSYEQVQATVKCCKQHGVQIRTRSGGHDYEGQSYTSRVPFILLDLQNLNPVNVRLEENSVWVQSGATVGELYYWIVQKAPTWDFQLEFVPLWELVGTSVEAAMVQFLGNTVFLLIMFSML